MPTSSRLIQPRGVLRSCYGCRSIGRIGGCCYLGIDVGIWYHPRLRVVIAGGVVENEILTSLEAEELIEEDRTVDYSDQLERCWCYGGGWVA